MNIINGSDNLWASVWTHSLDRALSFTNELHAKTVTVNCDDGIIAMPFTGFKVT